MPMLDGNIEQGSSDSNGASTIEDRIRHGSLCEESQRSTHDAITTHCHIERLPSELKIKILQFLSHVATLSSLVHASPSYYQVYAANRENILTIVTLSELQSYDIDLLKPWPFVDVQVGQDTFQRLVKPTLIK